MGFTQLERKKEQTDKFTLREKRCRRKFSESKGVCMQVKFTGLLARYLDSIEIVYILLLLRCGI